MLRVLVLGGDRAFANVKYKNLIFDQVNLVTSFKIYEHHGRKSLVLNETFRTSEYDAFFVNGYFEPDILGIMHIMEMGKVWFNQPFNVFSSEDAYKQLLYAVKSNFATIIDYSRQTSPKPVLNYTGVEGKTSSVLVFGKKASILSENHHVLLPKTSIKCKNFVRHMGLYFGSITLLWTIRSKDVYFKEFSPYLPIAKMQSYQLSLLLKVIEDRISIHRSV